MAFFFTLALNLPGYGQNIFCLDFEALTPGTSYGVSTGHMPGDVIFEEEGVPVSLVEFEYPNGTTGFGNVFVESVANPPFSLGNGLGVFPSNISLQFDLTNASEPVIAVEFVYYDYGGEENLQVNGGTTYVVQDFSALPNDLGGGISAQVINFPNPGDPMGIVALTGPVETVVIGGQELHVDNLCVAMEAPNPVCEIGELMIEPLSCDENSFFVLLDFPYGDVSTAGFEVTGNGTNYGTFSYSDLPVEVGPFFGNGLSSYELAVSDLEFPNCGAVADFSAADCADLCEDFDGLEPGTVYGLSSGYEPGDTIFTVSDIVVTIDELTLPNGATSFGAATVSNTNLYGQFDPIQNIHLIPSNVNLTFDFTALPYPVTGVRLGYAFLGPNFNLGVNGEPVAVVSELNELPMQLAPGVTLELIPDPTTDNAGHFLITGNLELLTVGGQEFAIDNLCVFYEGFNPVCGIGDLDVSATPCDAQGLFFVTLDFPFENVGTQGFTVQGNGTDYGVFEYGDLPITLGPLEGNGTFYEFIVTDVEFPDCSSFIEFGEVSCPDLCVQFEDLDTGASYGSSSGNAPGDVIFTEDNVEVSLAEFEYFGGTTGFGDATITNTFFVNPDLMIGNRVFQGNINLVYDFTNQPGPVSSVSFAFVDGGGEENFGVNGHDIFVLNDFSELPLQALPAGIEVTVTEDPNSQLYAGYVTISGLIETLTVGGQESTFDNFCFTYEEVPCEISVLELEVGNCNPNGVFEVWVNFEVSNPGNDFFEVFYEGENIGFYPLAELPVWVGGLTGTPGDVGHLEVCINDVPNCCSLAEFIIPDCEEDCEIWDLIVEPYDCDADGNFLVDLAFNHNNTGTDGFEVMINGDLVGSFAYNELPITLGPLAGDGTAYSFLVYDLQNPNCAADYILDPVDCGGDCEISGLELEVGNCNPNGVFEVWVNFEVSNPGNDFFEVFYEGENIGFYPLAELPVWVGSLTGTPGDVGHLEVCINDVPNCCSLAEFIIPDCEEDCEIWDLIVEPYDCDADGNFLVDLAFNHNNTGTDGFEVMINGDLVGSFAYNELPITLGPLAGDGTTYSFLVYDLQNPNCAADYILDPVDCGGDCEISGLELEVGDCNPNGVFEVWLNFEVSNPGNDFFEVFYEGENIGFYPLAELPVWVGGLTGTPGDVGHLEVCINDVPNCCSLAEFIIPDCEEDGPCIEFEEPPFGSEYSASTGYLAGDTMLVENDVVITLDSFFATNTLFYYGTVLIEDVFGGGFTLSNGQYPFISNSSLVFDFTTLPGEVVAVSFDYYAGGGDVMISLNGGGLTSTIDIEDWELLVFPGVEVEVVPSPNNPNMGTVFFTGELTNMRIGGQELGIDNVCFETFSEDCAIGELEVFDIVCDGEEFFFYLDFEYENVGNDGFVVFGNGDVYGTYEYGDLPIFLGPFIGDGETIYELIVEDVQDESCSNFTEFGPVDCNEDCHIFDLFVEAVDCAPDGTFGFWVGFEYENPGNDFFEVFFDGEFVGFYPLNEIPVWIEGLTGTPGEVVNLEVCINDQPDCCTGIDFEIPDCDQMGDVWPGDINLDNIAQNFDVLNLGIAFGTDGPARANETIDWAPQVAEEWSEFFAENDANYKHADCNGDGVVDLEDLEAIDQNYNETHGPVDPFVPLVGDENDPPFFADLPDPGTINVGEPFTAHIVLGSMDVPVEDIYGIAFTIVFDPEVIDPASVELDYPASWMGAPGVNLITFDKQFLEDGIIEVALVRNDQNNVNGFGKVVDFIGIIDDVLGKAEVEILLEDVKALMVDEVQIPLYFPTETIIINSTRYMQEVESEITLYPNPTSDLIWIESTTSPVLDIQLTDLNGRLVRSWGEGTLGLDLKDLPSGVYLVRIQVGENWMVHRVVKM
jgi:hypothetical protein